jgi:hypothetical protein
MITTDVLSTPKLEGIWTYLVPFSTMTSDVCSPVEAVASFVDLPYVFLSYIVQLNTLNIQQYTNITHPFTNAIAYFR